MIKAEKALPPKFTDSEVADIRDKSGSSPTFYDYVIVEKENVTGQILTELDTILNGKIPRNFVIMIKGGIGRQSGIFKSCLGHQLALKLDPTFTYEERVGFTINELTDKIKKYGGKKQIYVLDERVRDLKTGAFIRLANIIESCREDQLSFIVIGIPDTNFVMPDYCFERLGESDDDELPKKTVYYSVRKDFENKRHYRGFLRWNITELSDKQWGEYWNEYMTHKKVHQERAKKQELTGFDFKKHSNALMKSNEFRGCIDFDRGKLKKQLVKNLVYLKFPDVTNEERKMIYSECTFTFDFDDFGGNEIPDGDLPVFKVNDKYLVKYKCGHTHGQVIIGNDSNHIATYIKWNDSVGGSGNRSQCWNCYLRNLEKLKSESDNGVEEQ